MRAIELTPIKEILAKLPSMKLKKIRTIFDSEDGIETQQLYYFTSKENIEKITINSYFFTTLRVKLYDSEEIITIYSDNVNREDETLLREYTNDILSPYFKVNDDCIVINDDIKKWLNNMGVTEFTCNAVNIMGKYRFNDCIKTEKQGNCTVEKYNQTVDFSEEEIEELFSKIDVDLSNRLRMVFDKRHLIH